MLAVFDKISGNSQPEAPPIDLMDYPAVRAAMEKIQEIETSRNTIASEITQAKAALNDLYQDVENNARLLLNSGQLPDENSDLLIRRLEKLGRRKEIYDQAAMLQRYEVEAAVSKIKEQVEAQYGAEFSAHVKGYLLALLNLAQAHENMLSYRSKFADIHPVFAHIFPVIGSRVPLHLNINNEYLKSRLTKGIEQGHITRGDIPAEITRKLGL